MKKILLVAAAALTLAGCQTERQDRAMGGALIGGGAGALDATTPNRCRYVDRYGRTRWYRC